MPPKKPSKKSRKRKNSPEAAPVVLKIPRIQVRGVAAAAPPIAAIPEEEEEATDSDPQENPYADLEKEKPDTSEDEEDSDAQAADRRITDVEEESEEEQLDVDIPQKRKPALKVAKTGSIYCYFSFL